jgi:hypothetical protein
MAHFSVHHCRLSLCYHQMPSNKITLSLCISTQKIIQNFCPRYLLYLNVHDIPIYDMNLLRQAFDTPLHRFMNHFLSVLLYRMLLYFVFFEVLSSTLGEEVGYDS